MEVKDKMTEFEKEIEESNESKRIKDYIKAKIKTYDTIIENGTKLDSIISLKAVCKDILEFIEDI